MPKSEEEFGLTFAKNVNAATDGEMTFTVAEDTRISQIQIIIYGAETLLKLDPYVRTRSGDTTPLIETVGKSEIDGHNDKYKFGTDIEILAEEEIVIGYENQDDTYTHRFRVNINLEETEGVLW